MWWVWLLQECVHLACFHKPNTPHAVNSVWKHYCNAVFLSPLTVSGIQPVDTSTGVCGCECAGGWSVYSALLAWYPAYLLITLYSECLRPMWGVAVGSIACNVTKHIRDGYSRLVETGRFNQTRSACKAEALLSSPLCLGVFHLFCHPLSSLLLISFSFFSLVLVHLVPPCLFLLFVSSPARGYLRVSETQYVRLFTTLLGSGFKLTQSSAIHK